MYWLLPPPYLRWLAAAAVFVSLGAVEMAQRASEPYPFTTETVAQGDALSGAVEWRDVPLGLLPPAGDPTGFAARGLAPGEPIASSAVRADHGVPDGWWSVPIELPPRAEAGMEVRLVAAESGLDVTGRVVAAPESGAFATMTEGLVAVPPEAASAVAVAASRDVLIVLLAT